MEYNVLWIVQIVCLVCSGISILAVRREKNTKAQSYLELCAICVTIYSFGYLMEFMATDITTAKVCLNFEYMGMSFIALCYALFMSCYCQFNLPKYIWIMIFCFDVLSFACVLTSDINPVFYSNLSFTQEGLYPHLVIGRGPMHWLKSMESISLTIMCGYMALRRKHLMKGSANRHCMDILVLSTLFPVIGIILDVSGVLNGYDMGPFSLIVANYGILYGISKNKMFDVVEQVQESLFEGSDNGIIVVDTQLNYLEANDAAKELFPNVYEWVKNEPLDGRLRFLFDAEEQKEFTLHNHKYRKAMSKISGTQGLIGYSVMIVDVTNLDLQVESKMDYRKTEAKENKDVEYDLVKIMSDLDRSARTKLRGTDIGFDLEMNYSMPCHLYGDVTLIRQTIRILSENALIYTKKGFIRVGADFDKRDADILLKIKIVDSGVGIRRLDMDKVFDAKESHNGLADAKYFMEQMGGNIRIESKFGVGTTVYLEIPQRVMDETIAGEVADKGQIHMISKGQLQFFKAPDAYVLVVDDDEINRKEMENLLRPFGMHIDLAEGGAGALEKMRVKQYDLIFMDHMMPDLDGVETTRMIRQMPGEYCQNVPIIAMTASIVGDMQELFARETINDCLEKPADITSVCRLLAKWLPDSMLHAMDELEPIEESMNYHEILQIQLNEVVEKMEAFALGEAKDMTKSILEQTKEGKIQDGFTKIYEALQQFKYDEALLDAKELQEQLPTL